MARPGTLPRGITLYRGRYRVRLSIDGHTHALGMYDTLGDAKAALAIAKGEAVRGAFVPPSEVRVRRPVLRTHVLPTLGNVRLIDVTTQQVADLLGELRSRPSVRHPGARANGITHTRTIVLRSMINAAVKREAADWRPSRRRLAT